MSLDMTVASVDLGMLELVETERWRPALLHVSVHWVEDFTLLILTGEVCLATVPLLYRHVADIAPEARNGLVVDLGLVTFLDASGLSFLIATHKQLTSTGTQLIVSAPSRQVRRLFDLTGLTSYLMIVPAGSEAS
jgi:anti-sigma B factor antagonist